MISHKLNEVLKVADSVTILRDGTSISSYDVKADNLTETTIIKDMVGRDLTARFPERNTKPSDNDKIMEVKNWTVYHPDYHAIKVVEDASFYLKKGEVLAFCGHMGAGRTELMMSIFGQSYGSRSEGEVFVHGKKVDTKTTALAMKAGLGYVSEDRKSLGLILIHDIKTNISVSSMDKLSRMGIVSNHKEISEAERYRKELRIKTPSINQITRNLSGGNQQKVVLSRTLLADPEILIVDEPTRGIDVGAKWEIYNILNELVAQGKSVIIVTSELPEALGMADRIYVMSDGKIKGELMRNEASQEEIMRIASID
jgi:putative multiple sugar transport system ATP-binding protein